MSAAVSGFQLSSEKVWEGSERWASSMMAAKEEVTTTRRTWGADLLRALRMPVVPLMAGSRSSFWGSPVEWARC
jgi:hypothetical protein